MSYILFVVFSTYGLQKGMSISEFKTKHACEVALGEAKQFFSVYKSESKCIEVKEEK